MKLIYSLIFYFLSSLILLYGQASPDCKVIYIEHENADPGDIVCLDIKTKSFQDMLGVQFTLNWDPEKLDFSSLDNYNLPNLTFNNFNTTTELLSQGKLSFVWFNVDINQDGISLNEDEAIFSICFEVKGNSGTFAPVSFTSSPAMTELSGWPGPQAFDHFITTSGGIFIGDFPQVPPLELISPCIFEVACNSASSYAADIQGGTRPYSYQWSKDEEIVSTTDTIKNLSEGRYRLLVTDANQQELEVEFLVSESKLDVSASITNTSCEENTGAIDLSITGGTGLYDFVWSDNNSNEDRTDLAQGTYSVTIIDELYGCVLTESIEVKNDSCTDASPKLSISNNTVLQGEEICLDITGAGLKGVKGFDIELTWDSSIVNLDKIQISNLPGEENTVLTYNEQGNSIFLTRRYAEAVDFENGEVLLQPCFIAISEGGSSNIEFEDIKTRIIFDGDDVVHPSYDNGRITLRSPDTLFLHADIVAGNPGDKICMAVRSREFKNISSLQYALEWDTTMLDLINLENGVFPSEVGENARFWLIDTEQDGRLSFVGHEIEGATVFDEIPHYELCFTAKQAGVAEVRFSDVILPVESFNNIDQWVPVVTRNGLVNIGEARPQAVLRLDQNSGEEGDEICLSLDGEQFEGLRKLELNLTWDSDIINYNSLKGDLTGEFGVGNWEVNQNNGGQLSLKWMDDQNPVSFFQRRQLVQICFQGIQAGSTLVSFGNDLVFESDNANLNPQLNNGSITVRDSTGFSDRLTLLIPDVEAAQNHSVCVPVFTRNFKNIVGLQYSHHWNPSVLSLDSVIIGDLPGLQARNFFANEDTLNFAWTASEVGVGINLPDSSVLYVLCFSVKGEEGDVSNIIIDGNPVPIEVVSSDLEILGLNVDNGSVTITRNFVWPGDTDHNGIANHQDLLNIGLAYNATGLERGSFGNLEWKPNRIEDWQSNTPLTLLNYKHIDADGNGVIEALDTAAIIRNWGKTTPWYEAPVDEGIVRFESNVGAPLFVAAREEVRPGKNTFDVILGTTEDPAEEIYGLAFSIFYEYEGIDSEKAYAAFGSTWLGTVGDNLLTLQRNDPENNRIDIAMTRIDGRNISGEGIIASLHLTIEDIILLEGDNMIQFRVENITAIDVNEEAVPTAATPSTVIIQQQTTPTTEILNEYNIEIFPNPATNYLLIRNQGTDIEKITILTPQGRVLRQMNFEKKIYLDKLDAGLYFIKLEAQGQAVFKPFIIIH